MQVVYIWFSFYSGSENILPRSFSSEYYPENCNDADAYWSFLSPELDFVSLSKNSSELNVTSNLSSDMESLYFNIIMGWFSCKVSIDILEKDAFNY